MLFLPLVYNIALLISLALIYGLLLKWVQRDSISFKVITGLVFGGLSVIGMLNAIHLAEGVYFDGRSIIISVAGLFGGPVTAIITMLIAGAFRIHMGGSGLLMGLLVIISSGLLGSVHYTLRKKYAWASTPIAYLGLGFLVHLAMLFFTFTLPEPMTSEVLNQIIFPVLVIYPTGSFLLILLFENMEDQWNLVNQLYRERLMLRTVIDNLPDTIYVKDRELRKTLANKAELNILNKAEADVIGKTDRDMYPEDLASLYEKDDLYVVEKGEAVINREEKVVSPDGRVTWLLTTKTPLVDQKGAVIGLVGIGRDISERRQIIAELAEAKETAEAANRSKSEFLANMSHEIRTPMNAILGFTEALYHKLVNPEHRKMLQSVASSGNLLLSLLNDILDLSKIEAGHLDIVHQPVDVAVMVREFSVLFTPKAKAKGLALRTNIAEGFPPLLELDETRIKQVLFNLVGNAIKFTHQGSVEVAIRFEDDDKQQGTLHIMVSDTGIGISEDQFEQIFEPFHQQEGQSNRQYGGTGLGLPITQRLVQRMQGKVLLSSEPGKGSTFTVVLPGVMRSTDRPVEKARKFDAKKKHFKPSLVLIVDDAPSNLEIMEIQLQMAGLDTMTASSGEQALELLNHHKPDLVLLDILMPGMDGVEVAGLIRKNENLKDLPLIAFTALVHETKKIEQTGLFNGMIHKPVHRQELLNLLRRFLPFEEAETTTPQASGSGIRAAASLEAAPSMKVSLANVAKDKLSELLNVLKTEYLPEWEQLKDQWVLFKIEDFSRRLKQTASEYGVGFLETYAESMRYQVDILDLEALRENMYAFPGILAEMEKQAG